MEREVRWTIASAKARFSEAVDRANSDGPQTISRNGEAIAVLVSMEELTKKSARTCSLASFLMASPLRGADIDFTQVPSKPRPLEL